MPAHTGAATLNETTYAISASLPATYDAAGYGATTITYTTIGKVESFPEFGSNQGVNEFVPVSGDVEYAKDKTRYGGGPMVVADVPADAGQVICKAAAASANHYSMKITYPDGEIHYVDVLVSSWSFQGASAGAFAKRSAQLTFCKAPVVVAAS